MNSTPPNLVESGESHVRTPGRRPGKLSAALIAAASAFFADQVANTAHADASPPAVSTSWEIAHEDSVFHGKIKNAVMRIERAAASLFSQLFAKKTSTTEIPLNFGPKVNAIIEGMSVRGTLEGDTKGGIYRAQETLHFERDDVRMPVEELLATMNMEGAPHEVGSVMIKKERRGEEGVTSLAFGGRTMQRKFTPTAATEGVGKNLHIEVVATGTIDEKGVFDGKVEISWDQILFNDDLPSIIGAAFGVANRPPEPPREEKKVAPPICSGCGPSSTHRVAENADAPHTVTMYACSIGENVDGAHPRFSLITRAGNPFAGFALEFSPAKPDPFGHKMVDMRVTKPGPGGTSYMTRNPLRVGADELNTCTLDQQ